MPSHLKKLCLSFAFSAALTLSSCTAGTLDEAKITICEKDSDCIIVAYSHCCGSTKRAINRKYEEKYKSNPAWQKFFDPKACAVMGACVTDRFKNAAVCEGNGAEKRCQLISE